MDLVVQIEKEITTCILYNFTHISIVYDFTLYAYYLIVKSSKAKYRGRQSSIAKNNFTISASVFHTL